MADLRCDKCFSSHCICPSPADVAKLTQELAAVRAELATYKQLMQDEIVARTSLLRDEHLAVKEANRLRAELATVLRSDPHKAGVDAERALIVAEEARAQTYENLLAAEKERDEANAEVVSLSKAFGDLNDGCVELEASVAVLVSTLRGFESLGDSPETALIAAICRDALANLPAATQSLLREVEALRGIRDAGRFGECWSCCHPMAEPRLDWCQNKIHAALDAVEAGRKG